MNDNYLIILDKDEDMNVYEFQKKLCFSLKNCHIYDNYLFDNRDNNIAYINYNNKIYMIIKQTIKKFYIKYINII
jgi:hypothetical protein